MSRPLVDPQALMAISEDKWEHSIVQALCVKLNLSTAIRNEMRDWASSHDQGRRLTFAGFRHAVPEFPLLLAGRLITNLSEKVSVAALFRDFQATVLLPAYARIQEELDTEELLGMVFRWPRLGKKGQPPAAMVIHDLQGNYEVPGVRFTWRAGRESRPARIQTVPRRLTMCSLELLLDEILFEGWDR